MNYKKPNYKPVCITGAVLLAIGVGFLIARFVTNEPWTLLVTVICGFAGFITLLLGLINLSQAKKASANVENPSSIAHRTYGGSESYKHFSVILDRKGQAARNAAVNALGVVGMIFGGGGVFVSGTNYHDAFVNDKELVLNSTSNNKVLNDSKFSVIPANCVSDVKFQSEKKFERVIVSYDDSALSFDVRVANENDRQIVRDSFSLLLPKKAEGEVFEGYSETAQAE